MHFVTGGAFNGKSAWVKAHYQIDKEADWFSAIRGDRMPEDLNDISGTIVIMEGIEYCVKELLTSNDAGAVRTLWNKILQSWLQWEKAEEGRVVCFIGSDITKGIVPASEAEREWRDTTGRIYQDTAAVCERVDLVWYGMNQRLK